MIKSAKPITHLLRENYADGTHSLAAHVLNMRFYIHPVAGYQCDRQIVELGGEKRELRGDGAVASARRASLPGPPPQCEILPHSHCSRINLLVSFFSGKTQRDCLLRQSWPCGAGFFFFPQQIEHQEAISYQSVWFWVAKLPGYLRVLGQSQFHQHRKEIGAQRARDAITKFCWCENISLTMNLHTMPVIFHTLQANLILRGRSCLSAAAVMNHVCEGRKMHVFLYLCRLLAAFPYQMFGSQHAISCSSGHHTLTALV